MNKGTKIFMMVCAGFVAVGVLLTGIGFAVGGSFMHTANWEDWDENDFDNHAGYSQQSLDVEAFHSIDVDCDLYDVEVTEGEAYGVKFYYKTSDSEPDCRVENGVLKVTAQNQRVRHNWKSFWRGDYAPVRMEISYPKGTSLKDVRMSMDAGDVTLDGLTCQSLELDMAAGDVDGYGMKVAGMKIEAAVGDIDLEGLFTGVTKIECDAGDVTIDNRLRRELFSCDLEVTLGDLEVDDRGQGSRYQETALQNHIIITCSVGDLEVNSGTESLPGTAGV